MKEFVEFLNSKNFHFKKLNQLHPRDFGSRKKLTIYEGTDLKSAYWIIFLNDSKSRFIQKNALEMIELSNTIISQKEHNFKEKIFFHSSPICSKAKATLEVLKWRVINDFM